METLNQKQPHKKKQLKVSRYHLYLTIACIGALIVATIWILSIIGILPNLAASIIYAILTVIGVFTAILIYILGKFEKPTSNPIAGDQDNIWSIPYRRNPFFTGRKDILHQLHDSVGKSNDLILHQPQILSGLGGIGKTQIALEFAYSHQQNYKSVLWLRAETRSILKTDIMAIPNLFPLQEAETDEAKIISTFKEWLTRHENWLLILDNVDDLKVVQELIPTKGKGSILFTTLTQTVGNVGNKVEVKTMDQKEGVLFLLRRAKRLGLDNSYNQVSENDRQDVQEIVAALGGLPLALDQAGAYIEDIPCTFSEYRKLLEKSHETVLSRRGSTPSDHPESVASTFLLSFQKIEQDNPAAADLLQLFAFLSPDEIPNELLEDGTFDFYPKLQKLAAEPAELNEAIATLSKYSLIRRNTDAHTFTIHRVVQMIIKNMLDENTKHKWAEQAVYVINQMYPLGSTKNRMRRKRLFPQAQQCFDTIQEWNIATPEAGTLLTKAATYLRIEKRYQEAEFYGQQALKIREQVLGAEHPDVATTLHGIGLAYSGMGKYELSETFTKRALTILQKALGPDNPETLSLINDFAYLYYKKGDYETAEQIYQQNLVKREQVIGPESIGTSTTLNNLALIYTKQGKYEDAEILYNRALAIRFAASPKSINVAITSENLGRLYFKQGKYDLAEQCYRDALQIREQAYHEDTLSISDTLIDLANLYKTQRLYKKAEPLYHRALVIRENIVGLQPSIMIEILEDYADLLRRLKRVNEAKTLELQARTAKENNIS